MERRQPAILEWSVNVTRTPELLENTLELGTSVVDESVTEIGLLLLWNNCAYDVLNGNSEIIAATVGNEHGFKKPVTLTLNGIKTLLQDSHKQASKLITDRLLSNHGINYQPKQLDRSALKKYSDGLFAEMRRFRGI